MTQHENASITEHRWPTHSAEPVDELAGLLSGIHLTRNPTIFAGNPSPE
jgi:hypothetical protein